MPTTAEGPNDGIYCWTSATVLDQHSQPRYHYLSNLTARLDLGTLAVGYE